MESSIRARHGSSHSCRMHSMIDSFSSQNRSQAPCSSSDLMNPSQERFSWCNAGMDSSHSTCSLQNRSQSLCSCSNSTQDRDSCKNPLLSSQSPCSWSDRVISAVRVCVCFAAMAITTAIWTVIMILLLPWPYERIKQGNRYGHVTGRILMWILGNPIQITGLEHSKEKTIYICNHASILDIFLVMWLIPLGTVGIAKKEVVWYPLFGQLYILANHLRIDRSNPAAAIKSLNQVARSVLEKDLSLIIFPEGTRSATGRLLPFKKGVIHIALQTKRPIVPIVITGTHLAMQKASLRVTPVPLTVKFLTPIRTEDWVSGKAEYYLNMLHQLYVENLPECQKPLV